MRNTSFALPLMLACAELLAQTLPPANPPPVEPVPAETIDCDAIWQTTQATVDRSRNLASAKRWKDMVNLFTLAASDAQRVAAECPEKSQDALALGSRVAVELQQAHNSMNHQAVCEPSLDKAFDADIKVSTARRENRELSDMDGLLKAAEHAWQMAVNSCSETYRNRAERSLRAAQKARAENAELLSGGPACDGAWKNALAINDLAKDAKKAKHWDEAANLYDKAHMAWERVDQNCTGSRQQSAAQKIDDAQMDAYNAEFCGPQWDDANDLLAQLNKAKVSGVPYAERDQLMIKTEVLWREAANLCRGDSKSQAKMTADAIARERGVPLPPNAMAQFGKNRSAPAVAIQPAVASVPAKQVQTATPVRPVAISTPSASIPVASAAEKPSRTEQAKSGEPGLIVAGDTTYRGNFKMVDGLISGEGTIEWPNGDIYRGLVVNGMRHGKGRMTWKNGQWQDGDWKENIGTGKAVIFYPEGNRYEGMVVNGAPHGQGTLIFTSGDRYTGNFEQSAFHGRGTYFWKSGSSYTGDWVLGQKHGNGRMTMADGSGWEGAYQNDQETPDVRRFRPDDK